ncbi:MAG: DUF4112 domain-containing protein [Acidobacteria bacterium]|nr:DUF4112 domain-containing protein [Acidobacteriota bacterium]MCA1627935.1 DUF4112 domain-containing protein [Acidobacteriota bacterium]
MRAFNLETFPLERTGNRRDANVETSLERLGWLMDDLFRVPVLGWRFGLDALIGLIPGFGDTATSLVSFYILASAVRYRVPKVTLARMGLNIALDYIAGSLPVVGDLVDAAWKSNHKNLDLLKKRATVSSEEARSGRVSDWLFVGGIMLGLIALAIGSALVSFYLLLRLAELLAGTQ